MPAISELWAWVIEDTGPDDEGVPGYSEGGWLLPMIGADRNRAESLRPLAEAMAESTGKQLKLVRSTALEVVEVIEL